MRDDSMPFAHVAVGVEGCSFTNPDYFPLMIAANVMGSYDRSMNVMPHRCLDNKIGEYSMVNHEVWRTFVECVAREDMVSSYQSFNISYKNTGRKIFINYQRFLITLFRNKRFMLDMI